MKVLKEIVTLAVIVAIGFAAWKYVGWPFGAGGDDVYAGYAEDDCKKQILSRHPAESVSVYRVDPVSDGYRVRASARIRGEKSVKMICLANEHGRVEDIFIDER